MAYIGRFAPTPSGPLHMGSLSTALLSWLDARIHSGKWHLRIDDIDTPRIKPGSTNAILQTLRAHGLDWDGPVQYQSTRLHIYREYLEQLEKRHLTYRCNCSRKVLKQNGLVYKGTCRNKTSPEIHPPFAIRLKVPEKKISIADVLQGTQTVDLAADSGDFIIQRRDGIFAYHFATVLDDFDLGVTNIVRGIDLLPSTFAQVLIRDFFSMPAVSYAHVPLWLQSDERKFSKQNSSRAVENHLALQNLRQAAIRLQLAGEDETSEIQSIAGMLDLLLARWQQVSTGHRELPHKVTVDREL